MVLLTRGSMAAKAACFAICVVVCALFVSGCQPDSEGAPSESGTQTVRSNDAERWTRFEAIDLYNTSEGVAATVSGVEIGATAVKEYAEAYRATDGGRSADAAAAESAARDYLVDFELLRQAASSEGISVDAVKVREECEEIASGYSSVTEFRANLSARGLDGRLFAMAVEYDMLREALKGKVASASEVSDEQLLDYLNDRAPDGDGESESLSTFSESQVEDARKALEEQERERTLATWLDQYRRKSQIAIEGE